MRFRIILVLALLCLSAGFAFGQVAFTLTSSPNPSIVGQTVTLTAGPAPSFTIVTFYNGGNAGGPVLGSAQSPAGGGSVSIPISTLPAGFNAIVACYVGPVPTCTLPHNQQVNAASPFTLTTSPNPSNLGQPVTLTAGPVPSFTTVTFLDGGANGTPIGSATSGTNFNASVTIQVSTLTGGTHQLIACYPGESPVCSNPVTQVVTIPTTLTFTSSKNPSSPCDAVVLTATVVPTNAGGTVTGSVTFFDGTATLGTGTLSAGSASITVPSFTLGTHLLQARYNPDPGYGGSSQTLAQVVSGSATATLSSAPNPSNFNQTVVITVTVAAVPCQGTTPPPPTGTVKFFDGTSQIGQANLVSGTATFSTSTLAVGTHPLDASYLGDQNYAAVDSNIVQQVVNNKTNTTTTLSTSASTITTTQPVTLTATVAPSGATGQVQFKDGTNTIGTATLSGGGASFTASNLTQGTHSLTAAYQGDNNFNPSTSNPVTLTVNLPPTAVTLTCSPSSGPTTVGQPYTSTCTASGGTAPYTFGLSPAIPAGLNEAQSGPNVAVISGTPTQAGPYSFGIFVQDSSTPKQTQTVTFTGTLVVVKQNTNISLSATPNPTAGQPITITATVTPSGATGAVTFTDNGSQIGTGTLNSNGIASFTTSSLTQGNHAIGASYPGDNNFNGSSTQITLTVGPPPVNPTTTTLTVSPNPANLGQTVIMTANVSPSNATGTVTGTVTFNDNGSPITTGIALNNGVATFTTSSLSAGSHTIVASYGGAANFNPSSSNPVTLVVNSTTTQTTLTVSPNPSTFGQTVVLNATVTVSGGGNPTGTVAFNDGNNLLATVNLTGGTATFSTSTLAVGNHSLVASYSGNATLNSSTSNPVLLVVNKAATTTVLTPNPTSANSGAPVTLTAKVAPTTGNGVLTGTVTFFDGTSALGPPVTVANGSATTTISTLSNGNHSLTAVYSGDANFLTSTSPAVSVSIGLTGTTTTLAVAPTSSTFGQTVTLTATVTPPGSTGNVTFLDGTTTLGSQALANGTATFTTSTLSAGTHSLTAVYGGNSQFATSTSTAVTETVSKATSTTVLTATPSPSTSGQQVTLRAVVTPSTASGTVTFLDGTATLGTGTLSNGAATFATSTLSVATHSLTATYAGDTNVSGSTSTAVTQVVNPIGTPLGSISPNSLPDGFVGVPYSVQFTVAGGAQPLTWVLVSGSVPGLTLSPGGLLSGTPTTAVTNSPLGIQVRDSNGQATGFTPPLTVRALPAPSISTPPVTAITDQPVPQLTISPAFALPLIATFQLTFVPNAANLPANYTNPDVVFIGGGTTSPNITIPANSTTISLPAVQLGSVAGTITVRLLTLTSGGQSVLPATPATSTIPVPRLAPTIVPGSVKIINITSTGFSVFLDGTSTPRDLTSASLTFTAASGATLNGATATVSLTSAATTWFADTGSGRGVANGGKFSLTMPFSYSGDPTAIGTASVTLTNSVGTSPAVSGGR